MADQRNSTRVRPSRFGVLLAVMFLQCAAWSSAALIFRSWWVPVGALLFMVAALLDDRYGPTDRRPS